MNKIQIIVDVVLVAAVAALFVLFFDKKPAEGQATSVETTCQMESLPIAYLNVDSLLANYAFAQDASERLMQKQEDARLKLNTKARSLQQEMADFQHKLDNNAFLSRERAESAQQKLIKKQQDLQELEAKLTDEIMLENQNLNKQLADTLTAYLEVYNADGRYQIILSNTAKDNVLMAADKYDITNDIVNGLNRRYVSKKNK